MMSFLYYKSSLNFFKILSLNNLQLQLRRLVSSLQRQNFSSECENALNEQVNLELKSGYAYLAMAYFFHDKALNGAFKFFKNSSDEENQHACLIMEYINKRGGQIILKEIEAPKVEYETLEEALVEALKLEKHVNQSLLDVHAIASKEGDPNLCDFIESNFLQEQVNAQKQIYDYIQKLERAQNCVGSFLFDLYLAKDGKMH